MYIYNFCVGSNVYSVKERRKKSKRKNKNNGKYDISEYKITVY